nr:nucleotidyl transferase AbiEii/AbiGii toxin family protein [Mesorhizobium sp.]
MRLSDLKRRGINPATLARLVDEGILHRPSRGLYERADADVDISHSLAEVATVQTTAFLGTTRIPVQVDIGFGDAVTPTAQEPEFPSLLSAEGPRLRAYPRATVVAEKLQAIVVLGQANSRMKDFYDLLALSRLFAFEGGSLV